MSDKTFKEKWLDVVDKKNSVLCAGLDPAEFSMGRGEKGLLEGVNKRDWALKYVESVAPYAAVLKPNFQYWKGRGNVKDLMEITLLAHSLDLVVIDDSKLADIGSTNDAGMFYAAERADAVTFSPFAGNIKEATQQARNRDLGLISMVLMSNPEFEREKNKLVEVTQEELDSYPRSLIRVGRFGSDESPYVSQYVQLAHDAHKYGVDGMVIGAPSSKNHIEESEISNVRVCVDKNILVLLPGVGAQGGEAEVIWKSFDKNAVIINVGRSLMLPSGSDSTHEEQSARAKDYKNMLNSLREK